MITRTEAETAKARARALESDWWCAERVACVKTWNDFCAQEAARMARSAARCATILPGVYVQVSR